MPSRDNPPRVGSRSGSRQSPRSISGFFDPMERCRSRHPNPQAGQSGVREAAINAYSHLKAEVQISQVRQLPEGENAVAGAKERIDAAPEGRESPPHPYRSAARVQPGRLPLVSMPVSSRRSALSSVSPTMRPVALAWHRYC
jgi:hypothetical protein